MLVKLIVPLMVMTSPATADDTADLSAASVVTVTLLAVIDRGVSVTGVNVSGSLTAGRRDEFFSLVQAANTRKLHSNAVLLSFFIMAFRLMVKKIVTENEQSMLLIGW